MRRPPSSTLFPYTTLFRSVQTSRDAFRALRAFVVTLPEVLAVFHVSGAADLQLHVAVRDVGHLRDLKYREYFGEDRKSTRLNSSHSSISYAVFCLKKKTYT